MQLARQLIWDFAFLNHIEAAAVYHPNLRRYSGRAHGFLFFAQTRVEPSEVIRRPNPHDARKDVHPAGNEVEPFADDGIDVHFWSAMRLLKLVPRAVATGLIAESPQVCVTRSLPLSVLT